MQLQPSSLTGSATIPQSLEYIFIATLEKYILEKLSSIFFGPVSTAQR